MLAGFTPGTCVSLLELGDGRLDARPAPVYGCGGPSPSQHRVQMALPGCDVLCPWLVGKSLVTNLPYPFPWLSAHPSKDPHGTCQEPPAAQLAWTSR